MYIIDIIAIIYIITFICIIFHFVFIPILSRSLIAMICRKRSIQASAEDDDTHSDGESAGALQSPETVPSRKHNSKDLVCLKTVTWLCAIWIWPRAFLPKLEMTMQTKCSTPNFP